MYPARGNPWCRYHLWKGEQVAESPCSLDCRAVGSPDLVHRWTDQHPTKTLPASDQNSAIPGQLKPNRRFSAAVEDGTICGGSGLQLCLAGTCEVGHDTPSYFLA